MTTLYAHITHAFWLTSFCTDRHTYRYICFVSQNHTCTIVHFHICTFPHLLTCLFARLLTCVFILCVPRALLKLELFTAVLHLFPSDFYSNFFVIRIQNNEKGALIRKSTVFLMLSALLDDPSRASKAWEKLAQTNGLFFALSCRLDKWHDSPAEWGLVNHNYCRVTVLLTNRVDH